jgi:two-component system cell cycle response regulator
MVGDRERILASGFIGYIGKPIDPEKFPGQVQAFLGPGHETPACSSFPQQSHAVILPAGPKRGLVLFVDNSLANVEIIEKTLQPSGYQVVVARSAAEGLDLARAKKPDLIISDIHMPHQDGYAFRHMLEADHDLSQIPFFFLSSSIWSTREAEHARQNGANKFLSRPIEPQVLLAEIESSLQKGKEKKANDGVSDQRGGGKSAPSLNLK